MMINYLKRNELDDVKYDECIKESFQSLLYAYSWYLDSVVNHWGAFVLDDYKAVMPIPCRKKYGISYVYPPFWILQLGIFSKDVDYSEKEFINELKKRYKFIELRLNHKNIFRDVSALKINKFQRVDLSKKYEALYKFYQSDRKKDIKKAQKHQLIEKWNDTPENLINLFKENVGKKIANIQDEDYVKLGRLIEICIAKQFGEIASIYQGSQLVASAFFLKYQKTVTILCSSTDFSQRSIGANTYLIDRAIYKYQSEFDTFNFGGSSMASIARYFKSFGATSEMYGFLKINNLPFFFKFFKK